MYESVEDPALVFNIMIIIGLLAILAITIFCDNKQEMDEETYYLPSTVSSNYGSLQDCTKTEELYSPSAPPSEDYTRLK